MTERAGSILEWLVGLPEWLIYLLVGTAAAVENVIPPVPADVIVVIGGVIAGAGQGNPYLLFLAVWFGNVGSALLTYALGRRYGAGFFEGSAGRFLLAPRQLAALQRAYAQFGFPIIFLSRFLPVFRPIVPVFAGVSRLGLWRTALPIALASALWYGLLVYLGTIAGANWQSLLGRLEQVGGWLWLAVGVLLLAAGFWWYRTRLESDSDAGE